MPTPAISMPPHAGGDAHWVEVIDGQGQCPPWRIGPLASAQQARRLARGEVEKKHRELRRQPELHLVEGAPSSLYLISNHDPEKLARRYLWLACAQLLVFFLALGFLARGVPA